MSRAAWWSPAVNRVVEPRPHAALLAVLVAAGCAGDAGPCPTEYLDPVLNITSVLSSGGQPVDAFKIWGVAIDGRATNLSRLVSAPAENIILLADTLVCPASCAFGTEEGTYTFSVQTPGYERQNIEAVATYAERTGGCPATRAGGIEMSLVFTRDDSPVMAPLTISILEQDFGVWNDGFGGYHLAEDLYGEPGAPVRAIAAGTVRIAATGAGGYGGIVLIDHEIGGETVTGVYGHLSARRGLRVQAGAIVPRGTLLGYLADDDEDGGDWGPHFHFGIRRGPYSAQNVCGIWHYVGYSRTCTGTDHDDYLNAWYDPGDFLTAHR